jgi:hypothetical protein
VWGEETPFADNHLQVRYQILFSFKFCKFFSKSHFKKHDNQEVSGYFGSQGSGSAMMHGSGSSIFLIADTDPDPYADPDLVPDPGY